MTITELITELLELKESNGDLEVDTSGALGRTYARKPRIAFRRIYADRGIKTFWNQNSDSENLKGEKVVYL